MHKPSKGDSFRQFSTASWNVPSDNAQSPATQNARTHGPAVVSLHEYRFKKAVALAKILNCIFSVEVPFHAEISCSKELAL